MTEPANGVVPHEIDPARNSTRDTRRVLRSDPAQIRALVEAELEDARLSGRTVQLSPLASLHELAIGYLLARDLGRGRGRRALVREAESSLRAALIPVAPVGGRARARGRWSSWLDALGVRLGRSRQLVAGDEGARRGGS